MGEEVGGWVAQLQPTEVLGRANQKPETRNPPVVWTSRILHTGRRGGLNDP